MATFCLKFLVVNYSGKTTWEHMLHLGRLEYVLRDLELHVSDINPKKNGNKVVILCFRNKLCFIQLFGHRWSRFLGALSDITNQVFTLRRILISNWFGCNFFVGGVQTLSTSSVADHNVKWVFNSDLRWFTWEWLRRTLEYVGSVD